MAATTSPVGTWKRLVERWLVCISAVSVDGAQLEEAPVSEMPDGIVPFNTCVFVDSSFLGMIGDQ